MSNGLIESDLAELTSTYRILTAERILERFNVHLAQDVLIESMNNPKSVYFQMLIVPFKNVINGIILQQAYDYQVYAQKLFVDYLISGSGNENDESPGANIRQDLESNRLRLTELSEQFDKDTIAHKTLIHQTQAELLKKVQEISPIEDSDSYAEFVAQALMIFYGRAEILTQNLRDYRAEFKELILNTIQLLKLLPDYRTDPTQDTINRESLLFDDQL